MIPKKLYIVYPQKAGETNTKTPTCDELNVEEENNAICLE